MKNFETEPKTGLKILQEMAGKLRARCEEGRTTPHEIDAVEASLQEHDPIPFDERLILADLQQPEADLEWYPLLSLEELDEALEMNQELGRTIAVCRWEEPDFIVGIQIDEGAPFLIYQTRDENYWLACCGYGLVSIDPQTRQVVYHGSLAMEKLTWAQITIQGEAGERSTKSIYGFRIPLDPAKLQEAQYLVLAVPALFELASPLPLPLLRIDPQPPLECQENMRFEARGFVSPVIGVERDALLGIDYRVEARNTEPFLVISCDNDDLLNKPCIVHFYWRNEGTVKDYSWKTEHIFRRLGEETFFLLPGDADVWFQPLGHPHFACALPDL